MGGSDRVSEKVEPERPEPAPAAFAGELAVGGLPVDAGALGRLDPAARASTVTLLQRAAGNAAVARMAVVSRQPQTLAPPATSQRIYNRDRFDERYTGVVDPGRGMITLWMGIDMQLAPQFVNKATGQFDAATVSYFEYFKKGFKEVVERIWSGAHALRPLGPFDRNFQYETEVRVAFTSANPHAEIYLHPKTLDVESGKAARSCAQEASVGQKGIANLQEGDNVEKERTMEHKGKKLQFFGNTSAHEFGHLLGLDHVNQRAPLRKTAQGEWTDEDRYGVTPEQSMDIMGRGTVVSARDMAPFIRIAEEYGKDVAPGPEWNKWKVVGPG